VNFGVSNVCVATVFLVFMNVSSGKQLLKRSSLLRQGIIQRTKHDGNIRDVNEIQTGAHYVTNTSQLALLGPYIGP
jgi:hypothetical protein